MVYFFFFGEAAFFDFAGDEDAELDAAPDLAVFGLGALGFLVGPPLFDFFTFEGDFGLIAALAAAAAAFDGATFLSPAPPDVAAAAADVFFDFDAEVAVPFFSVVPLFVFGDPPSPPPPLPFLATLDEELDVDFSAAIAPRLVDEVFLVLPAEVAFFFLFSVAPPPDGFATPDEVADANLKEPDAPLPLV